MNLQHLLTIAAELLYTVRTNGQEIDQALSHHFQDRARCGSRDRALIADVVYNCLRHLRSLGSVLGHPERSDWHLTRTESRLRVAAWLLFKGGWPREAIGSVLGAEADLLPGRWLGEEAGIALCPAVAADLPDWLYDALLATLGESEAQHLATALLQSAPLDLRVNTLRTTRADVVRQLRASGIEAMPTPFSPVGVRLPARTSLGENPLYRDGRVEIQDEGSQLIALLLAPRRHEVVVDFCAGAGGKTLHLGALMADTGSLYALDTAARRLDQLRVRVERAGLLNVRIARIEDLAARSIVALRGKVDRVLVDAPCTGTGTLRRNPDIKWRSHDLAQLTAEQGRILAAAATLVRPGGRLVYATCSLLPEENEAVVAHFLANHADFAPLSPQWLAERLALPVGCVGTLPALQLYPHRHGTDGFYAALLVRSSART